MRGERTGSASDVTQGEFVGGQRLFSRYTLIKILGKGGMGIVWLAHDEELERQVALKFLPDLIMHDAAVLSDLKRETRRCLELTHKNIVRIYDFVHDERSGCISMEYVDGDTLSNLRCDKERKVFEPAELTDWMSQLCDALDYAHNYAHIIHRDLKPADLMVNQRGELKVSDFGIARSLGDSMSVITMAGGRSGTLSYMSPQQLEGERGTHLDDIYSLGASVYELLTSKPPFYVGNIDHQIREKIPPSLTERRKEFEIEAEPIPAAWEEWVAACLAKDPGRRPQAVTEIAHRLQMPSREARLQSVRPSFQQSKKRVLALALASLCLLALGGWYFGIFKSAHAKVAAFTGVSTAIPQKSIAVLPFENLSANQENAFFADGVQDEILTDLAKIADLRVISRTSVIQYRSNAARNLREIGKALGVAYLLEGSVQRADNRVRVNAQLVDARTDAHLWAQTYDRDLADVFAIQTEIAKSIAGQLQAKLSPREEGALDKKPTNDLAAYDLYLKALEIERNRASTIGSGGVEGAKREVDLLNQAVARDPAFVPALCKLAQTHLYLYWVNADHTPARLDLAKKSLDAATRLQPDAGEVHLARAILYYWGARDYAPALAELAVARPSLPNDAGVLFFTGMIERRQGKWDDSTRDLEQLLALDPRNIVLVSELAASYIMLRQYDAAARTVDSALAWKPLDFSLWLIRASIDMAWKADLSRWKDVVAGEAAKTADPNDLINARLDLALKERDYHAAEEALSAHGGAEFDDNGFFTPLEWNRGIVARGLGGESRAKAAFLAARERAAAAVRGRSEDGKALMVVAQIDAALGRKEDAIREGERAVELLPIAKDAVIGDALLSRLAGIYTQTGEADRAFNLLEQVTKIPFGVTYGSLKLDEVWDPLRSDARFEKIVASLAPKM